MSLSRHETLERENQRLRRTLDHITDGTLVLARNQCLAAGFDVHLAKPPDIPRLEQLLSAVHP